MVWACHLANFGLFPNLNDSKKNKQKIPSQYSNLQLSLGKCSNLWFEMSNFAFNVADVSRVDCREDGMRRCTEFTPWYSGVNKFCTQKGTGGFLKYRDVLPHTIVSV